MPTEKEYKDNIKRFNHYMDLAIEESKKNHWRNVEELTESARMCAEYMFVYKNSPYDKGTAVR